MSVTSLPPAARSLEEELRRVWGKPINKTPVAKDLPRLAGRIIIEAPVPTVPVKHLSRRVSTLRLSQITEISEYIEESDKLEVVNGGSSSSAPPVSKVWRQISKAIIGVASNVETIEKVEEIREGLQRYNTYQGELELAMNDLLEEVIGADSKTARVFKAIHQNILFVGCYELKTKVPMNMMTKDVRGPEGWRILISFTKDTCSVTHYKREESLATAPPTERFWFEWKIHMIFDKGMNELQAAFLKVTNLGFGDEISDIKKAEITKVLCAGNVLIS